MLFWNNLIPVTIGNWIGGVCFLAVPYALANGTLFDTIATFIGWTFQEVDTGYPGGGGRDFIDSVSKPKAVRDWTPAPSDVESATPDLSGKHGAPRFATGLVQTVPVPPVGYSVSLAAGPYGTPQYGRL